MSERKKLSELPVGSEGVVAELPSDGRATLQLREMGILPGTRIKLVRAAPLGDPLEFVVRGYHLSLRKREAERVLVDPV